MKRILILEDEDDMGENLSFILEEEGYQVEWYKYGEEAVEATKERDFDLLIVDITLAPVQSPLIRYSNGIEVVKVIRETKEIPYMFLTSRVDGFSVMQALDSGAEDYVGKPFDISELLGRIRKALRGKNQQTKDHIIETRGLVINPHRYEVKKDGEEIYLSRNLYEVLYYLASNLGKVVSSKDILEHVWGNQDTYEINHVAVNIGRLRKLIGQDYIKNKRGQGYVFE